MAKLNVPRSPIFTHEGAVAQHINPELQLRRSVLSCMLWENTFYEDGLSIAERINTLVPLVDPGKVAHLAIEARNKMKLRHAPLLLVRAMTALPKHKKYVADTLAAVIQRPDELTEFLAIYWKDNGNKTISAQVKKGLARAFTKFSPYQLAKYNRDGAIKLRDVLFLCHANPISPVQELAWKQLIAGTLPIPDTWEVELSASTDKTASWTRLLRENKLGALALLRNLRNMKNANVHDEYVKLALQDIKVDHVLPFRFVAAARHNPVLEPDLETAMFKCIEGREKIGEKTILLVDVSGSMDSSISDKSEMTRMDAACGLAVLAREIFTDVEIFTFSTHLVQIPNRRGFALRDAIHFSQEHSHTYVGQALAQITIDYDRLIIFTDEQSHDSLPNPKGKGYVINVATNSNGVGYGAWNHIDGFSEACLDYIIESEKIQET